MDRLVLPVQLDQREKLDHKEKRDREEEDQLAQLVCKE
jgi:hypothetical protein